MVKSWSPSALVAASAVALLLVSGASAQVILGSIDGTVTDESGAVLPGVTITATSPSLQVPELVVVSGPDGRYRFGELPAGLYRITFVLSGFTPVERSEIRLTSGFAARVNVTMVVGGLQETLTVSGQSPLVDVTQTRGNTTVSQELLSNTPNSASMMDAYLITGGVLISAPPMQGTGGVNEILALARAETYGQPRGRTAAGAAPMYQSLDGVLTYPHQVPDLLSVEEVSMRTYGNTAEVGHPGAASELIVKSGGNELHGRVRTAYQDEAWSSHNIDDRLRAQGLSTGREVQYYGDMFADLGGRIVRDKLWFYGAFHNRVSASYLPGFALDPGPDGRWDTADDTPAQQKLRSPTPTVKLSYQPTRNHRFTGMYTVNITRDTAYTGERFIPLEATYDYRQPFPTAKADWQATVTDRLVISTLGGYHSIGAFRKPQPCCASMISRFDAVTGQQTGSAWGTLRSEDRSGRTASRYQLSGSATYVPSGSHQITAGYIVLPERLRVDIPVAANGEYRLVYRSGVPTEFWTRNAPLSGDAWQGTYVAYASDSWRASERLTVNAGLRWSRLTAHIPEKVKAEGPWPFARTGLVPAVDVGDWKLLAPRVGVALDLFGNAKTVVKATYGVYHDDFGYGWVSNFDPNYSVVARYRWIDRDNNNDFTLGEVNLDPNGTDILGVAGTVNRAVNPDLEWTRTHEMTAAIQRDMGGNVSAQALYVFKKLQNDQVQVNSSRPYEVWDQRINARDPGPDGRVGTTDDGNLITFFDYNPAYRGSAFVTNTLVHAEDRASDWHNLELRLEKRQAGSWFANTSLLITKNHRWIRSVIETPNDELFPLDRTWVWAYRLTGGYQMPGGILVSSIGQVDSGIQGQRVAVFTAPNSGNVTLPVEEFGEQQGPTKVIVNLRTSKALRLGVSTLDIQLDVFNLFNSNDAFGLSFVSGSRFGAITDLPAPRVVRLGASLTF